MISYLFRSKILMFIIAAAIFAAGDFKIAFSAFNEKINYQGKLTDSGNVAVADGVYDIVFKLYDAAGGGSTIWTESWTNAALWTEASITFTNDGCAAGMDKVAYTTATNESSLAAGQYLWNTTKKESAVIQSVDTGNNWVCVYDTPSAWATADGATNRVYVKNGLFSVMLGSVSSLSAVDFNQTLYLGVTVGADSEMKPRKVIGAVPAAFEAKKLGGKTWAAPDAIGSGTPAAGSFTTLSSAGLTTVSGGAISLNASSNFNVDIGTGTSSGIITIGNATVSDLALNDAQWSITGLGAATFASISTGSGAIGGGAGSFTTLTSSGNSTLATGSSTTNTFGSGASSVNTIGSATTPGALTLHGATTLDNTFTVSGSNLTTLGGNLTVTGTAWTATPTISGLITATSGFDSNAASTVAGLTIDGNGNLAVSNGTLSVTAPSTTGNAGAIVANSLTTGSGLDISSTSAAGGGSGVSKLLNLARSGANSNASHTAYGLYSAVTNTGTTSTNVGGYFSASGATNNYGLIVENGKVGIGTTSPTSDLQIVMSNTGQPRGLTVDNYVNAINAGSILLRKARGTVSSPSAVLQGDAIGSVAYNGYDGTGFNNEHQAILSAWASQNWTTSNKGTYLTVQVTPDNSTTVTETVRFLGGGQVGIGSTAPTAKLDVNGLIRTTSLGDTAPTSGAGLEMWYGNPDANTGYIFAYDRTGNINKDLSLGLIDSGITIKASGNVGIGDTSPAALLTVGNGDLFQVNSSGQIAAIAGYTQGSGNFSISGTGTFGTGTGAISLNGDTAIAANKSLTMTAGTGTFSIAGYSGTGNAASITSSSTTNLNKALNISQTGATTGTDYGFYVSNTGAGTTNVGGYFSASGATNNYAIDARGDVIIGDGTAYGDSRLVIAGTDGSNDSAIVAVKRDGTTNPVFSVFPFDDSVFISAGVYYSNGAWVHNSNDTNSQILGMSPAAGTYWFASSDSSATWNVANAVNLWDTAGIWKNTVQSTATGNSYFTGGNVGIGDTTPDGKLDVEPTGAVTAASYGINLSNLTTNVTTNGINKYGAYITSTGSFTGSTGTATNNFGLYVDTVSGADNNYGAYIAGNTGIGTTAPEGKLHILSGSAGTVTALSNANQLVLENNGTGGMSIITTNNSYGTIYFGDGDNVLESAIQYYHTDNQLQFFTSYTTDSHTTAAMVMTNTGKIGINDMTPDGWLDIEPTGATTAASYGINLNNIATNATTDAINKYGAYITSTGTFTGGAGVATNNYGLYVDTVSGADNNYGAYIAGNTGIGTAAPAYQLELSTDSAAKPSTNTWTIASDERIKKDIKPFSDGLSVIEKINPIWYKYNGLGGFKEDGKENIGVLAQTMEDIAPYTVNRYMSKLHPDDTEETELLNFNSHALTFIMINSIKEQQKQIEELKLAVNPDGNITNADGEAIIASLGQNQNFKDLVASVLRDTLTSLSGTVMAAGEWTFEKLTAKQICVEDICVDRDQLKNLLDKNQIQVSPTSAPAPSATPAPSPAVGEEIPFSDTGSEASPAPEATLSPEANPTPVNQLLPEDFSNTNVLDETTPDTVEPTVAPVTGPVLTPEPTSVPDPVVTPVVAPTIVPDFSQEQGETMQIPDSAPAQSSEPTLEFTSSPANVIQP